ncbi:hypothetical protein ABFA07_004043 [Porites harrisoni]
MRQKPEEESEKNLFQKILRPENCPGLSKITVNQVIWDRVSAEARTGDVKMQRVQSALVKGTTNVALIADLVLKSSEDKDNIDTTALLDKLWKLTEDSLCCLGAANWELVQRRREALKPQISKDYAHLCAQKVKFTDSLFGDDVTKQIKDITDDNKVTHKLLDKNRSWYRPSHANRGSCRGRAGFRGSSFRGRGSTNRPFLRPSTQYRTTTYSKPRHNQETPKN